MADLKLCRKAKTGQEALAHSVKIFTDDIEMKLGLQKCEILVMRYRKKDKVSEQSYA